MGGTGGSRTETTPTAPQIPPELQPLVNQAVAGSTDAMALLPFTDFVAANPQLIHGLTSGEMGWLDLIQQWATDPSVMEGANVGMDYTRRSAGLQPLQHEGAGFMRDAYGPASGYMREGAELAPGETEAMGMLRRLFGSGGDRSGGATPIGAERVAASDVDVDTDTRQMLKSEGEYDKLTAGAIGDSPATREAMAAWEQYTRPEIQASLALTGNLGGGAVPEAFARGKTEALVPLLQEEIETRRRAASELGQLGLGVSGQHLQADSLDAELAQRAATGNADRRLSADQSNQQAQMEAARTALQWAGLDQATASQLAAIAAGGQERKLQAGQAIGNLGLGIGQGLAEVGRAGSAQDLAAGGQAAAIGSERARLQMDLYAKALEAAGMPREVANQQAQAQYNDFLRRQALAEGLYLGPTGNFLAGALTPGSLVQTRQTGGGLFGS